MIVRAPLFVSHAREIAEIALRRKLPSVFDARDFAAAGGLLSYGANLTHLYEQAASYVEKILRS